MCLISDLMNICYSKTNKGLYGGAEGKCFYGFDKREVIQGETKT